jgi:hypothetical protein
MSQHDYVINNQGFVSFRNDLNNALGAIQTNNSGATEPSAIEAYQWWYDTSTNTLKFRNADDDAWINFASFDMVNDTVNFIDSSFTQLTGDLASNGYDINFADSDKAQFGASQDLQIYHDGSNSYIDDTGAGNLFIQGSNIIHLKSASGASQLAKFTAGGASELYHNGTLTLATTSTGLSITGGATFTANVDLADSDKLRLGTSQDLEVYHDGSNSYIDDNGSGDLIIRGSTVRLRKTGSTENMLVANQDGAVELYHNNSKKLETTASGITVTGSITADSFTGIEQGLTLIQTQTTSGSVTSVTFNTGLSDYENFILVGNYATGGQGNNFNLNLYKAGSSVASGTIASGHGNETQDWSHFRCELNSRRYAYCFYRSLVNGDGGTGYSSQSGAFGATGGDTGNAFSSIVISCSASDMKVGSTFKLYGVVNA